MGVLPTLARAQVWRGGSEFELIDAAIPELRDDELIVALSAATICGSDRHTVSGRRGGACPSILGHEGVGTVVASKRDSIAVDDRVVFSVTSVCNSCSMCLRGLTAKCDKVLKTGHESFESEWPLSGTYASHIHIRAGQEVAVVPDGIADGPASTAGCAVATVMAAIERAGQWDGATVVVNGIGMLGLIAVIAARAKGARTIIACDPVEKSRALVAPFADVTVDNLSDIHADIALELSGSRQGTIDTIGTLNIGGTAVLAGTVAPIGDVGIDPEWLVRGWRTVTGVHNYEPRHLHQAVEFLAGPGQAIPWDDVLGGPIQLADLSDGFAAPDGRMRTIVCPSDASLRRGVSYLTMTHAETPNLSPLTNPLRDTPLRDTPLR